MSTPETTSSVKAMSASGAELKSKPETGARTRARGKNAGTSSTNAYNTHGAAAPLSARRSQPLDLSTVERAGQSNASRDQPKRIRPYGLPEAPTFRPTEADFKDPIRFIQSIAHIGNAFGLVKIIPPKSWKPAFAIDTERFHFRTRRQELNSVEGGTRANLNYLDQLAKFHKQHGTNLNRFPSVDKRPLDLYRLKKAVEVRGGFETVCRQKKWAEIGRDLGYSGKIMSSLSTSLKNSYQRWLNPYEEYLRLAKPGVQMKLDHDLGGPITLSPAHSPVKRSTTNTPAGGAAAAGQASTLTSLASSALDLPMPDANDGDDDDDDDGLGGRPTSPVHRSASTPVNRPALTPVNATNGSRRKVDDDRPSSRPSCDVSQGNSSKNTPEHHPWGLGPAINGSISSQRKRRRPSSSNDSPGQSLPGHEDVETNGASEIGGRRSKRLKKEPSHMVAGSHMTLLRPSTPRLLSEPNTDDLSERCETCGMLANGAAFIVCDSCEHGFHGYCLDPPLKNIHSHEWHCPRCLVGTGEYGFEEGGIYSLRQFQEKAHNFKESYFRPKMPFDPVLNCKRPVTEDDVEREFWRLVESLTETVEVEYGADIHSTTHGSGFPTIERDPLNPYSTDAWNLNVLPLHAESLFRHIKSDISGMTVPWLYVGMCFSTFCWHNEDHYTYSANYQHFGATKTWYGIPAEDADKFENAMREAVPELFETQPDLLFQLVTLLPPDQLRRAGVRVYALDQRAGQFVITFPQAYHAGFNHGFNFNEAVNFAPHDWEPFGASGVDRLQAFRRQPCFSHDELLLTALARDNSIRTAQWLSPALSRLRKREEERRQEFRRRHQEASSHHRCRSSDVPHRPDEDGCDIGIHTKSEVPEDKSQCSYCKAYVYLSRFVCSESDITLCLDHAGTFECCEKTEQERFEGRHHHQMFYRVSDEELIHFDTKVRDRAQEPRLWAEKLNAALEDESRPSLKVLRSLLSEGERIAYALPQLPELKAFVDRCNDWVERAMNYIVRKQQNRRKNEKAWRKGNSAKAAELEERDRELRKVENVVKLLAEAKEISFSCMEINQLQTRADAIHDFQRDAQLVLTGPVLRSTHEIEELVELGKGFNVDIPEVERLDRVVQQMKWNDQARERKGQFLTLQDVTDLIRQGTDVGMPEQNELLTYFKGQQKQGEIWEAKAKELISAETVHYQQLEALSSQALSLPVSRETSAAVEQFLNKQREARRQVVALYEKSKEAADLHDRPRYREVKQVMDDLTELHSKPSGTVDLEREQKRHEDWMRKGKKLFGKANAPLHILQMHMNYVEQRNAACFNVKDVPRAPAEPSSREHSPDQAESSTVLDGPSRERDVFCICRQPESGMMIECELCHEWYHGKCLKIARGKVKEDDKYTCPICDWRLKIPRDAARPKLEDLQEWQSELPRLPFRPEEEDCLSRIVNTAQAFRDFVRPYMNPMMTTQEELPTQRFYLRKIEGAEVLLTEEANFFRQELHRWAPVAPEPPPVLEYSLSTRKPRPTKQQKLMAQLGIENPDDLPQDLKTKAHHFNRTKSNEPTNAKLAGSSLGPGRNPGGGDDDDDDRRVELSSTMGVTTSHPITTAIVTAPMGTLVNGGEDDDDEEDGLHRLPGHLSAHSEPAFTFDGTTTLPLTNSGHELVNLASRGDTFLVSGNSNSHHNNTGSSVPFGVPDATGASADDLDPALFEGTHFDQVATGVDDVNDDDPLSSVVVVGVIGAAGGGGVNSDDDDGDGGGNNNGGGGGGGVGSSPHHRHPSGLSHDPFNHVHRVHVHNVGVVDVDVTDHHHQHHHHHHAPMMSTENVDSFFANLTNQEDVEAMISSPMENLLEEEK